MPGKKKKKKLGSTKVFSESSGDGALFWKTSLSPAPSKGSSKVKDEKARAPKGKRKRESESSPEVDDAKLTGAQFWKSPGSKTSSPVVDVPPKKKKKKAHRQAGKKTSEDVPPDAAKSDRGEEEMGVLEKDVMSWLLSPVTEKEFFADYWEKKPLYVQRKYKASSKDLFSVEALRDVASKASLLFEKHINACRYWNGKKIDLNGQGRMAAKKMDHLLMEGATLQVHHPQHFSQPLHKVLSLLEERFGCLCGSNSYITPPGKQGLAPHYDDVEVFIIQLEGSKRWRLYNLPDEDRLPRSYSEDLLEKDLGAPDLEVVLHPGDLLYFPRGTIHQAIAVEGSTSHHVTISTFQQHAWVDFLKELVVSCIDDAAADDVELRRGLPVNFLHYIGSGQSGSGTHAAEEKDFMATTKRMLARLVDQFTDVDTKKVGDTMALEFMGARLPPSEDVFPTPNDDLPPAGAPGFTQVRLLNPGLIRMSIVYDAEQEGADEEEDPENLLYLLVQTTLGNDPAAHMSADPSPPDELRFPRECHDALAVLVHAHAPDKWHDVKALPGPEVPVAEMLSSLADVGLAEGQ